MSHCATGLFINDDPILILRDDEALLVVAFDADDIVEQAGTLILYCRIARSCNREIKSSVVTGSLLWNLVARNMNLCDRSSALDSCFSARAGTRPPLASGRNRPSNILP